MSETPGIERGPGGWIHAFTAVSNACRHGVTTKTD